MTGTRQDCGLLSRLQKKFDSVYAIVPNKQRSAVSGALTLHKPIRLHKITEEIQSINGTPADCVLFSVYSGEFEKPALILSGINHGDNTCLGPLIQSGTVGACWQAALEGIPSIAFSLHTKDWGDKEKLTQTVIRIIEELRPKLGPDKFFNVNLPADHQPAKIIYMHKFQKKKYKTRIEKRADPSKVPYFWITGETNEAKEGTDLYEIVMNKNITISEISLSIFKSE